MTWFIAGIATYFALLIAALMVHGIWVAPFIERHGRRTAGFVAHWMLGIGLIRDYLKARKICRSQGVRPLSMRWFGGLLLALAILVAGFLGFMVASLLR